MVSLAMIVILFVAIFAVLGLQLFGGRFHYCSDPGVVSRDDCVGLFNNTDSGQEEPRLWLNQVYNFDDMGQSVMLVVQMVFGGGGRLRFGAVSKCGRAAHTLVVCRSG